MQKGVVEMLQTGSVIDGKYKILGRIGQGGMSTVYLAINEKANKTWAIKEVRTEARYDSEMNLQRLRMETELLKKLRHPRLPSIVDVIDSEGSLLIVMDYIEGHTLESLLKGSGVQSQKDVIAWGKQLCEVLGYLHRQEPPIIYRDMKPSNVMLQADGNVKLIDFGTAGEIKEQEDGEDTVCLGTPGYAAPEQWEGCGQTDARTDIYCLGITLYHLLTGHTPTEYPYIIYPIRHWNSQFSPNLEKIILKCTQRDPRKRYESCEDLQYDLERLEELDRRCLRKQGRKLRIFLGTAALAVTFSCGAIALHQMKERITSDTYQERMRRALEITSTEEQIEAYEQAIHLKPSVAEGYIELLNRVFLMPEENGTINFEQEEDEYLRRLLNTKISGTSTYEQVLKEHPEDYDRLAYELGLAYYYYYETDGNKSYAVKWLHAAAASDTLPSSCQERARRLGTIAEYYTQLGVLDKTGDKTTSYLDYWRDLTELTEGNLTELDNAVTALRMYQELACQIYTRTQEFYRAGVTEEEMEKQLDAIQEHLQSDFDHVDWTMWGLEQMRTSLTELLKEARQQVDLLRTQDTVAGNLF